MEYEIVISDTCLEEIEENCYYIEKVLKAEQASNRYRRGSYYNGSHPASYRSSCNGYASSSRSFRMALYVIK